jgi:hypothetical protein
VSGEHRDQLAADRRSERRVAVTVATALLLAVAVAVARQVWLV